MNFKLGALGLSVLSLVVFMAERRSSELQLSLPSLRFSLQSQIVPVAFPNSQGWVYRAVQRVHRIVEQHYVDSERMDFSHTLHEFAQSLRKNFELQDIAIVFVESDFGSGWTSRDHSSFCFFAQREVAHVCPEFIRLDNPNAWLELDDGVVVLEGAGERLVVPVSSMRQWSDAGDFLAATLQWAYEKKEQIGRELVANVLNDVLHRLDPHSAFLNEEEYEELKGGTHGHFGGVGVVMSSFLGFPYVRETVFNSPAHLAGLEPNDILLRVDDQVISVDELDETLGLLRRRTMQGPVPVWFYRPRSQRVSQVFLSRDEIPTRSVERRYIPDSPHILMLKILGFSSRTSQELYESYVQAMNDLDGYLEALILDLRGNPGGLLEQAIEVADLFLSSGPIVSTHSRYDEQVENATPNQLITVPTLVLQNASSASASEIVAAALRDAKRAIVIGERSFGKGSVQSLFEIQNLGAIKLSVAHYFTPSGVSIQEVGVEPDASLQLMQPKGDQLWVAGTSERQREKDLSFHLQNPGKQGSHMVSAAAAQWREIWSLAQDDLSQMSGMGRYSFAYPNTENSDKVVDLEADAYVRVALNLIKLARQSESGIWGLRDQLGELIRKVRSWEMELLSASLSVESDIRHFLVAPEFVGNLADLQISDSAVWERDGIRIDFHPNFLEAMRARGLGTVLVGFFLDTDMEFPGVWAPLSLPPDPIRQVFVDVPPAFRLMQSRLKKQDLGVEVFVKGTPFSQKKRLVLRHKFDSKEMTPTSVSIEDLTIVSGTESSPDDQIYQVVVDFVAKKGTTLSSSCRVVLTSYLPRQVMLSQTEFSGAESQSCRSIAFQLRLKNLIKLAKHEFSGVVGMIVVDERGDMVGHELLFEIVRGRPRSLLQH